MEDYSTLKISELCDLLSARGLPTTYRLKADLITRLNHNRILSTLGTQADDSVITIHEDSLDNDEVFNEGENNGEYSQNNSGNGEKSDNGENESNDGFNGEYSQNNSGNGEKSDNGENESNDGFNGEYSQNNSGNGEKSDNGENESNDGFNGENSGKNSGKSYENGENKDTNDGNGNGDKGSNGRQPSINSDTDPNEDVTMTAISFRDIEEALDKFNGDPFEDVEQWIANFDEIAETAKWSPTQKYVFARKLLTGPAKKSVKAKKTISTYDLLTAHLRKEYEDEASILDIHHMLVKKRKTNKESYIEYMYDMIKIANDKIDDKAMVRYVVDGISMEMRNKITLYKASTVDELKKKLKIFDTLQLTQESHQKDGKNKHNKTSGRSDNDKNHKSTNVGKKRCYNCGDTTHTVDDCPDKGKGKKCYNCNQFGHISQDCRVPRKHKDGMPKKDGAKSVMCAVSSKKGKEYLPITILNTTIDALIDSGSPHTIMTKSTYKSIEGLGRWIPCKMAMKGLSEQKIFTMGYKQVTITINNEHYYDIHCYVVADHIMPMEMIIGRNLTDLAVVTITAGVPTLRKIVPILPENDIMVIQDIGQDEKIEDLPCITEIVDADLRNKVTQLVKNYTPTIGQPSCIQMEILVVDNVPVYQNPRRLSAKERDIARDMVNKFIDDGIVQPSRSPYASPILLRPKKNGTTRFCVDYRKINQKIIKDRYPLPLMEDVIEGLNGNFVFSTLDLKNGFYHVDMEQSSMKYTAFVTPDGHYEFKKAPFGLCNSPAIFQRFINMVFREAMQNKLLYLYLDDVIVPATDEQTALVKLQQVFEISARHGLIINFEKCVFLQRKIIFLGYIIENQTIRPSEDKTAAIRNFPRPTNIKGIQSFLGLTGYFRKFISHYAEIARPLSELLKSGKIFNFGDKQEEAYQTLKNKLCSEPVLKIYNPQAVTQVHTDASALGYGGCMLQLQQEDNTFHPIYYLSFKTSAAEAKLHSYELETLAVVKCLERLRSYLLGIKFELHTDCQAFEQTMTKKNATAKIARWALALEEFDMEVKHRKGSSMRHVDALSRNFVMVVEDGITARVKLAQNEDDECKLVKTLMEKGQKTEYVQRNGILYKFMDGNYTLKIPRAMVNDVLLKIHGDGHLGRKRMEMLVKQEYDITDLGKRIDKIINNCIACILSTKKRGKKDGWLNPIDKLDVPLNTYHIDHLGPMPSTAKSYNVILAVVDAFSKFTWLYPVKSTGTAEAITKLKLQQDIFGNPARIVADKGSAFRAKEFADYCEEQNIHLHLVTTGTPRGNGQVERINGVIIPIITKMAIEDPLKWYKFVPRVQRLINSTMTRSTKTTPFKLLFGVDMRNEADLEINEVLVDELINKFNDDRYEYRQEAKNNIIKIQKENQKQYNKNRREARLYTVGELVAIERTQNEAGLKFRTKMLGPYEVTKVKRNHRYEVQKIGNHEGPIQTSTSADKMKPWVTLDENSDDDGQN